MKSRDRLPLDYLDEALRHARAAYNPEHGKMSGESDIDMAVRLAVAHGILLGGVKLYLASNKWPRCDACHLWHDPTKVCRE